MISTCGDVYSLILVVVIPPLASIKSCGNSSLSTCAADRKASGCMLSSMTISAPAIACISFNQSFFSSKSKAHRFLSFLQILAFHFDLDVESCNLFGTPHRLCDTPSSPNVIIWFNVESSQQKRRWSLLELYLWASPFVINRDDACSHQRPAMRISPPNGSQVLFSSYQQRVPSIRIHVRPQALPKPTDLMGLCARKGSVRTCVAIPLARVRILSAVRSPRRILRHFPLISATSTLLVSAALISILEPSANFQWTVQWSVEKISTYSIRYCVEFGWKHLRRTARPQGFHWIFRIRALSPLILLAFTWDTNGISLYNRYRTAYDISANVKGRNIVFEPHLHVLFPCWRQQMRYAR